MEIDDALRKFQSYLRMPVSWLLTLLHLLVGNQCVHYNNGSVILLMTHFLTLCPHVTAKNLKSGDILKELLEILFEYSKTRNICQPVIAETSYDIVWTCIVDGQRQATQKNSMLESKTLSSSWITTQHMHEDNKERLENVRSH